MTNFQVGIWLKYFTLNEKLRERTDLFFFLCNIRSRTQMQRCGNRWCSTYLFSDGASLFIFYGYALETKVKTSLQCGRTKIWWAARERNKCLLLFPSRMTKDWKSQTPGTERVQHSCSLWDQSTQVKSRVMIRRQSWTGDNVVNLWALAQLRSKTRVFWAFISHRTQQRSEILYKYIY